MASRIRELGELGTRYGGNERSSPWSGALNFPMRGE